MLDKWAVEDHLHVRVGEAQEELHAAIVSLISDRGKGDLPFHFGRDGSREGCFLNGAQPVVQIGFDLYHAAVVDLVG